MSKVVKSIMKSKIGIFFIVLALVLLITITGLPRSTFYHTGWEIKSEIIAVDNDGVGLITGQDCISKGYGYAGPSLWRFDLDDPKCSLPDLEIATSDVREKKGVWPYSDLEQIFKNYKYIVTYKEYLFDVQVRTLAQSQKYEADWFGRGNKWEHETACPYEWHSNVDGTGGERVGEAFSGCVYLRFVIHPFGIPDFGEPPENYTFKSYWAGVMNAKMESKDMGKVETGDNLEDSENHVGWVKALPSDGAQLNMYQDDGSFGKAYSDVPWDVTKVLDPDIKSVVIVQIPFDIMAGAYEDYGASEYAYYGAINDLQPIDYYFTATIRIETFIVKYYTHKGGRDPVPPIDPDPITPPKDYFPYHIPSWWELYGTYVIILIIVAIIVFFVFAAVFGLGRGGIFFGSFRFYKPKGQWG